MAGTAAPGGGEWRPGSWAATGAAPAAGHHTGGTTLSASNYVVDILLILVVLRQIRTSVLTPRSALLPLVILAFAGAEYLKGFPTHGNDLLMDLALVLLGAAFGLASGLTTKVWRGEGGQILCQASVAAAIVWVAGMGFRMGFDIWANTRSGGFHIYNFAIHHNLVTAADPISTTGEVYATAFVLMAFAQVLIRVGLIQYRRLAMTQTSPPVPA